MKTAFVTGASRGIGKSIALNLSNEFAIAVGYTNSQHEAEAVVEEIKKNGSNAFSVQLDIGDKESVNNAFLFIEKQLSNVDILINLSLIHI